MRERLFPLSISRWSRVILVCSFCTVFGACSVGQSGQQRSARPPEAVSAQPAETAPLVYYVGVDQLVVYSKPRSSSSPLTQLPLHQKVYRYKMEKGYAYIKVEGSEVTGWVDNGRLIWRLPSQPQKTPMKTEEQAALRETIEQAAQAGIEQIPNLFVINIDAAKSEAGWGVRAEVVGPRVPSPAEVRTLETALQKLAGQPVLVSLWARTEVVVTGQRYTSVKEQAEAASRRNIPADIPPAQESPTVTQP